MIAEMKQARLGDTHEARVDDAHADTETRRRYIAYKGPTKNGLCYMGRLDKAMEMGGAAMASGDTNMVEAIKKAAAIVEAEAAAAYQEYLSMSKMSGEQYVDDVCGCEYCQDALTSENESLAISVMTRSIWEFLHPEYNKGSDTPRALELWEDGSDAAKEELGKMMSRILIAQRNYIRLCEQQGKKPAWSYLLRKM